MKTECCSLHPSSLYVGGTRAHRRIELLGKALTRMRVRRERGLSMRRGEFGASINSGLRELHYDPQAAVSQPQQTETSVCCAETLQTVDVDWERAWVDLGGEG